MFHVEIANQQTSLPVDEPRLKQAVLTVLEDEAVSSGSVSVAIVDDDAIRRLHRKYLNIDEPTDVLSFVLERRPEYVEGEVVASAQTARSAAGEYDWSPQDELLLYVIHGVLHLVGYDDVADDDRQRMRSRERYYLDKAAEGVAVEHRGGSGEP